MSNNYNSKEAIEWRKEMKKNGKEYKSGGHEKFIEDKINFLDDDLLDGNTHKMKITKEGIISARDTVLPLNYQNKSILNIKQIQNYKNNEQTNDYKKSEQTNDQNKSNYKIKKTQLGFNILNNTI